MKLKFLCALALAATLTASAQGYKDGIEYYKAGQYDNAITLLERNMNDAQTDKALAEYYLGQSFLAKNDAAKAQAAFEAGIAANAENPYNYVGMGALALKSGNAQSAKDQFKKAQSLGKKNTEVLVDIARAYWNADPTAYAKEIEELLKKAHKQSKDKEPAIYIFEGDRKAKAQDWNSAATEYEQAIYFDEDNPEGYVKYANVYFYIQPDYATQKLEELLQRKPNSALAQRELAEKYYESGKWTRAAQKYGEYIANPNHFPEDKARYAVLLYAGNKYDEAIEVCKEVLASDPDNFQVQRVLVRSLADKKETAKALEASRKFFANPQFKDRFNASDYSTMANLLKADSLTRSEALTYLLKGLEENPESSALMYDLSDYYFDQKDYPKSADYIEMYINTEKEPSRSDMYGAALNFLAATSDVRDDEAKRMDYGTRGMNMIDRAIKDVDFANIPPAYLRRKALIATIRNNNVTDKAAFDIWEELLKRLDLNPEYADPANAKNYISYYVDAWRGIAQYYAAQGDNEAMTAAKEKQAHYESLLPADK